MYLDRVSFSRTLSFFPSPCLVVSLNATTLDDLLPLVPERNRDSRTISAFSLKEAAAISGVVTMME